MGISVISVLRHAKGLRFLLTASWQVDALSQWAVICRPASFVVSVWRRVNINDAVQGTKIKQAVRFSQSGSVQLSLRPALPLGVIVLQPLGRFCRRKTGSAATGCQVTPTLGIILLRAQRDTHWPLIGKRDAKPVKPLTRPSHLCFIRMTFKPTAIKVREQALASLPPPQRRADSTKKSSMYRT